LGAGATAPGGGGGAGGPLTVTAVTPGTFTLTFCSRLLALAPAHMQQGKDVRMMLCQKLLTPCLRAGFHDDKNMAISNWTEQIISWAI